MSNNVLNYSNHISPESEGMIVECPVSQVTQENKLQCEMICAKQLFCT